MKLRAINKYVENPIAIPLQEVKESKLVVTKVVGFGGDIDIVAKPPKRGPKKIKEATQAEYKQLQKLGLGKFIEEVKS